VLALLAGGQPETKAALDELLRLTPLDPDARAAERTMLAETALSDGARAVIAAYEHRTRVVRSCTATVPAADGAQSRAQDDW
jgi:hypothetical protein